MRPASVLRLGGVRLHDLGGIEAWRVMYEDLDEVARLRSLWNRIHADDFNGRHRRSLGDRQASFRNTRAVELLGSEQRREESRPRMVVDLFHLDSGSLDLVAIRQHRAARRKLLQ